MLDISTITIVTFLLLPLSGLLLLPVLIERMNALEIGASNLVSRDQLRRSLLRKYLQNKSKHHSEAS